MTSQTPHRLDGWKAIAIYLGRDERTALRWRRYRGMPVHAVPGGKRGTVFAYASELDEWLVRAGAAGSDSDLGDPVNLPAGPLSPVSPVEEPLVVPGVAHRGWSGRRWLAVCALAVVVLSGVVRLMSARPPTLQRVEATGNDLIARDAEGNVAWTFHLTEDVPAREGSQARQDVGFVDQPMLVDLDGDGSQEVLLIRNFTQGGRLVMSNEVRCFSSRGRLRWKYRPEPVFDFGGRRFDGPWRLTTTMLAPRADGSFRLWLTLIHDVWWPSFVVAIEPDGRATIRYVNSGHLWTLSQLQRDSRSLILTGGINNEYQSAALAAFDADGPPSTSLQSQPEFTCDNCPEGRPVRYVVFPRTELSLLLNPSFNRLHQVAVTSNRIDASVIEVSDQTPLRTVYDLSPGLDVRSVAPSDAYWLAHRRLEMDRRLDHASEACPLRLTGMAVKSWTVESGWTIETALPPRASSSAARVQPPRAQ